MQKKVRLIFLIFLIVAFLAIGFSFKTKTIVCISHERECGNEITDGVNYLAGKSAIISLFKINNILKNNPLVEDYSVNITPKGEMIIKVSEKISKYCLTNTENAYHVDDSGVIMRIDGEKKGCINKNGIEYNIKDTFSKEEMFSLQLNYLLRNLQPQNNAKIDNGIFVIEYKGGIKLIFPLEGIAEITAGRVYYTLSQFDRINEALSGKKVTEADFRFKEPIIRYI